MTFNISLVTLVAFLFILISLFIIIKTFRMPEDHYHNCREREKLRLLLLKERIFPSEKEEDLEKTAKNSTGDGVVRSTE